MGQSLILARSNQLYWHSFNVQNLNDFRYIILSRTTTSGSVRGISIATVSLFKSHNSSDITFSVDDTDTTLAYYINDTAVALFTNREDRVSMLIGII